LKTALIVKNKIQYRKSVSCPKLIYFVTEDWYFYSHRLALAEATASNGFDVAVITRVSKHEHRITGHGIRVIPVKLHRSGINPFQEFFLIWSLYWIYRREKPTIVHHVAMKPVLEGTAAAYLAGVPSIINAVAGLGYIFSASSLKARVLRQVIVPALKTLLRGKRCNVIVQNRDDMNELINRNIATGARTILIRGSGVDTNIFVPTAKTNDVPIVLLASRMLWAKGVGEFVELARISRQRNLTARFVLVGEPDPDNHDSVPSSKLKFWHENGVIEWWGKKDDMLEVFCLADIVCLPTTYGEGVPKVLIEAAACGIPIVTTNVPGCREIVLHGDNGFLIPPGDSEALFDAVKSLLDDSKLRSKMGARGRALVISDFSIEQVIDKTLKLYRKVCP